MKTLLICHDGSTLDQDGLARWLASFSNLVGLVVIREHGQRVRRRVGREIQRVGWIRFADVMAFRVYYRLFLSRQDRAWQAAQTAELRRRYPAALEAPVMHTDSPNSPEAEGFIRGQAPDLVIARCKTLLKESVFSLPTRGTFVMHPGICPEYRNAHGCFWALARGDREKVGMTLLRIDNGVDTGPVYGYYKCRYDAARESHVVIQHRVVIENLPQIAEKLRDIHAGRAVPLDTSGRASGTWGQPWLTSYLNWRAEARRAGT